MTTTPADTLRAAAQKLRDLLADLDDCRGPWYVVNREQRPYPQRIDNIGVPYVVASTTTDPSHPPTIADYICAMHPGVGLAVARWLESWAGVDLSEHGPMPEDAQHALTVARRVLGETTTTTEAQADGLRDRIRRAVCEAEGFAWDTDMLEPDEYGEVADAVMAVLPTSAPVEPCGSLSQPTYSGKIMRCVLPVGHPRQCQSGTEYPWVSWPSPTAEADLLITAGHRLTLSEALGLGTGAPWDAIRDRAAELRRLADEAQQPTGGEAPYPSETQWIAEQHDGTCWEFLASGEDRGYVEGRLTSYRTRFPEQLTTRLIRKTATYTVEQPAPAVTEEPKPEAVDERPETDEEREQREDREETERLHAAGDHRYCDITCEPGYPSDMLRNGILCRAVPGSPAMLDELLRRAATPAPAVTEEPTR